MDNQAYCVVDNTIVRESLVTTLMSVLRATSTNNALKLACRPW